MAFTDFEFLVVRERNVIDDGDNGLRCARIFCAAFAEAFRAGTDTVAGGRET